VRKLLPALILVLVSCSISVLCAEFLFRRFVPQQLILLRPDVWVPDDTLGWRHASDLDTQVNTGERTVRLLTDRQGHRIGEESPQDSDLRILALGDSFLAALQVDYEDSFTALLEESLTADLERRVKIINGGVGSWGPNHYLKKARLELAENSYGLVLVFLYALNDIEHRVEKFTPRRPVERHPLRFPSSLDKEELVTAIAYPVNNFLETRSHLFIFLKRRFKYLLMQLGLSPFEMPWVLEKAYAEDARWIETTELCKEISDTAGESGARTLFVLLPGDFQVNEKEFDRFVQAFSVDPENADLYQPQRILSRLLKEGGLNMIDTTPPLIEAHQRGDSNLYGKIDTHLAPRGHQVVADFLMPHLIPILRRPEGKGL